MAEDKYTIELTTEEADLLSVAASVRANEFVRSMANVGAEPQLRAAWQRSALVLRALATRLAQIKDNRSIDTPREARNN